MTEPLAYRLRSEDLVGACCFVEDERPDVVEELDADGVRDEACTDRGYDWPRCLRCGEPIPAR
jgi:hypothetical protein